MAEEVRVADARGGARIRVRVKPGGSANRLLGAHGGALKLEVAAAAERGRANSAVVRLLARSFGVARTDLEIVAGATSRDKVVEISSLCASDVAARLETAGIAAIVAPRHG